jgi:hypothetical protein
MASAGTVTLELDANSVKLLREMQKAQRQTRKTSTSMSMDFKKAFTDIQKNVRRTVLALAGIATAAAAAATAMVQSQRKTLDELAKTSDALGIQQEQLQGLQFLAKLTGTSAEQLSTNLERMQRRLGEVARQGGAAERALDDIGVSVQDIINLKPDEQLQVLANALGEVENQAVKASIANNLFGRDGVRMLKLLQELESRGLQPTIEQLERMGVLLSRTDTFQIEQMNDALAQARERSKSFAQQFTLGVSGAVTALARMYSTTENGITDVAERVEELFDDIVIASIRAVAKVRTSIIQIKPAIEGIWQAFSELPTWAKEIGVVGAIMFGPKGVAAVALATKALDDTKVTAEWFRAYTDGEIGFFEWLTTGGKEARQRLNEMERDISSFGRDAATDGGFSFMESIFGKPEEDVSEWGKKFEKEYLEQRNRIARERAEFVEPDTGGLFDFEAGEAGKAADELGRQLQRVANSTRTQVERIREEMALVQRAIDENITQPFIDAGTTADEVMERLQERLKELENSGSQNLGQLAEFGAQAARNIQSSFANFLFDPFQEGLKGMLKGFTDMLRRMMAEAAASSILRTLFSGFADSENPVLAGLGSSFGGTRDQGGSGQAGKAYVINPKAGPEVFIPSTAGEFIPNIDEKLGGAANISLTIDARDAGAEARIKDMIMREMVPQIITAAKSETINTIRRPRFA